MFTFFSLRLEARIFSDLDSTKGSLDQNTFPCVKVRAWRQLCINHRFFLPKKQVFRGQETAGCWSGRNHPKFSFIFGGGGEESIICGVCDVGE